MGNASIAACIIGTVSFLVWVSFLAQPGRAGEAAYGGFQTVALFGLAVWFQVRHKHRLNKDFSSPRSYAIKSIVVVVVTLILATYAYIAPLQKAQATAGSVEVSLSGPLKGDDEYMGEWSALPNAVVETSEYPETLVYATLAAGSARIGFKIVLEYGEYGRVECRSQKRVNWVESGGSLSFIAICPTAIPFEDLKQITSATLVAN